MAPVGVGLLWAAGAGADLPPAAPASRFEQQLEQEQLALEQHRQRLQAEVVAEKERLGQQAARYRPG